ncbi:MAG: TrkH family potassium uptake protein [Spirochaetales bacterium]|nr:TrkH family potassium uptake protein [Spirochaetales bacterium]
MNVKAISRNVGYALLVDALFMFFSVLVSIGNGNDSALAALLISFTLTFTAGIFPFIFVRRTSAITLKDGYMVIVLSWILSFVFGMLPYALWGGPFTVMNAWFESVSGFTTTGATILDDIESLPDSLLFWRSATHFIGGLGVVVFLLLIIPSASPVRLRLTNMELSALTKDGYNVRANKIVTIFALVYLGIFALAFLSYCIAGMSPMDAVNHAFSVCAAGGFSSKNLSIAAFDSRLIEGLTMLFMYLASIHFGLIYVSFASRSLRPLNNPVLKFYTGCLVFFTVILALILKPGGYEPTWGQAFWHSAFQILCIGSSTGFAIVDNAQWPLSAGVVTLFIGVIGGMAGSCAGGMKSDRILMLIKSLGRQVRLALHPSKVQGIRIGKNIIRDEDLMPQLLYVSLFTILLAISVFLSLLFGVNTHSSFGASISTLTNVGPALVELGTMGSFNSVPEAAKFIYSMNMFFGRIEIYPILAVLSILFSRKRFIK